MEFRKKKHSKWVLLGTMVVWTDEIDPYLKLVTK
jgi:hypothetical protein